MTKEEILQTLDSFRNFTFNKNLIDEQFVNEFNSLKKKDREALYYFYGRVEKRNIELASVRIRYFEIFEDIEIEFSMNWRKFLILGNNGTGKTTLLKAIDTIDMSKEDKGYFNSLIEATVRNKKSSDLISHFAKRQDPTSGLNIELLLKYQNHLDSSVQLSSQRLDILNECFKSIFPNLTIVMSLSQDLSVYSRGNNYSLSNLSYSEQKVFLILYEIIKYGYSYSVILIDDIDKGLDISACELLIQILPDIYSNRFIFTSNSESLLNLFSEDEILRL